MNTFLALDLTMPMYKGLSNALNVQMNKINLPALIASTSLFAVFPVIPVEFAVILCPYQHHFGSNVPIISSLLLSILSVTSC